MRKIAAKLGFGSEPTAWAPPPPAFDEVYRYLLASNDSQRIIIDVGSHHGESIRRFRELMPNCVIHSFEPDSDNFEILQKKYGNDSSIFLNNCGIGDEVGSLTFHRYAKSDVSSFVEIDKDNIWTKIRSAQTGTNPDAFETKTYEVPVTTLDRYMEEQNIHHIDLLKMDTQGFEDKALKGGAAALKDKKIDYIELELIVKSPYKKALLFRDIENLLDPEGYKMYGIGQGSNYFKTSILQFDLLYARSECYREGPYKSQIEPSPLPNG